MPLFLFIFHILYNIHPFNHIHTIHFSVTIRRGLSPFPHRLYAQWERPPCGAEPGSELGPALQQADALPTEPRRTIN
jgi:hypothetical protein